MATNNDSAPVSPSSADLSAGAASASSGASVSPAAGQLPAQPVHVAPISIRLPNYWSHDPQLWFAQAEAHFANHRITSSKSRFNVVVSSLAPEVAAEVRDLLLSPPADDPYGALRAALVDRTQKSEKVRLRELLSQEGLGDEKPSRLLRKMEQLLGDKSLDDSLLYEMFVQRLPPGVRLVLSAVPGALTARELAGLADRVVESTTAASPVTAVTAPREDFSQLRDEIGQLSAAVLALTTRDESVSKALSQRGRSRERSPARACPERRSPSRAADDDVCWFHRRFGDKARHCRSPCRFSSSRKPSGNA